MGRAESSRIQSQDVFAAHRRERVASEAAALQRFCAQRHAPLLASALGRLLPFEIDATASGVDSGAVAAAAAADAKGGASKGGAHRARRREQRAALSTPAARLTRALTLKFGLREALGESDAAAVATHVRASINAAGVVDFDRLFSSGSGSGSGSGGDDGSGGGGGRLRGGELKLEICSGLGEWIVAQAAADRAAKCSARWVALEIR